MPGKSNRAAYQFKVELRGIQPPIWRRIRVWEDATLARLHCMLQMAMGWEDYHLHEFRVGRKICGVPDSDDKRKIIDVKRTRIRKLSARRRGRAGGCENYLAALADPEHEEHGDMLAWRGPFDPEAVSADNVNQQLEKKFRPVRERATLLPLLPPVPRRH